MLFSSLTFIFIFLPVVCALYFVWNNRLYRNVLLCAASLLFYAWGEPVYIFLMLFSIVLNYASAIFIDRWKGQPRRKVLFVITVVLNLLLLGFFKYVPFFIRNVNFFFHANLKVPQIALPIGISFYTFQALSYVIDVYRKKVSAQKNVLHMALYISLFPQLIAGPIVRYTDVAKEIGDRSETFDDFIAGLKMFMVGLGAKVILANNMAVVADSVFADTAKASTLVLWLASLAYTLQIYFDFAGYSRMAIGLGRMFGFHFPENFNDPYTADSITEFWRRWHMTLSSWFRDYVYIPLGGNRCSAQRHIFNILVTWLLTGFWHGAEWNFMVWGVYYGLLLVAEKYAVMPLRQKLSASSDNKARAVKIASWIVTLFFVVFGWVLFRTESLNSLASVISHLFTRSSISTATYFAEHADNMSKLFFMIPAVACCVPACKKIFSNTYVALAVFVLSACMLIASTYNPFIYFRF